MALSKQQKEEALKKIRDVLASGDTVAFVNFHGLGVADTTTLRQTLREDEVGYTVVKKTLAKRALQEQQVPGDVPELEGELAIAYGPETASARGVFEFGKRHEGTMTLLGGIFEGKLIGKDEMTAIAQIPALDVLRGMFVNIINSPIQRTAIALSEIAKIKA